jgi:hypothetical protein
LVGAAMRGEVVRMVVVQVVVVQVVVARHEADLGPPAVAASVGPLVTRCKRGDSSPRRHVMHPRAK